MFLKQIAEEITRRTDLIVDIEPSHANIDDSHFILGYTGGPEVECKEVLSSYEEDRLVIGDTNTGAAAVYENQLASREYLVRFPLSLRFRVNSSGQVFREDVVNRALEYCMIFNDPFKIGAFKTFTDTAVERIQAIIPGFTAEKSPNDLNITVAFMRVPENDVPFERVEDGNMQDAYVYEIYWDGELIFNTGQFTDKYDEFNNYEVIE